VAVKQRNARNRPDDPNDPRVIRGLVDVRSPSAEPFRMLRLAVDLRPKLEKDVQPPIVFTSADAGEGKSTVAANYALVAAQNDRRVLLIDADLRKPTQHRLFGVRGAPGLTEVIAAGMDFATLVRPIQTEPGVLHLLTAGTALPNVGDVVASDAMRTLFANASTLYDLVVVDSPPLLAASDAATLASRAGADVAFVMAAGAKRRRITRALGKLELVGANVLGFVMNREGQLSEYGNY
jgi:capsular exopolysaccharide synthesis family protein